MSCCYQQSEVRTLTALVPRSDKPQMTSSAEPTLILLLGGSGYIGTHLMLELHGNPYQVAIVAHRPPPPHAVAHAEKMAGGLPVLISVFDLETASYTSATFPKMPRIPHCAIMLAARKDVSEGEIIPHDYILSNVALCVNSMRYLTNLGVKRLIQASSSSIYHTLTVQADIEAGKIPDLVEDKEYGEPLGIYGYTKKITEDIVRRLAGSDQQVVMLRYMNPIGSHPDVDAFSDFGLCSALCRLEEDSVFINRGNCVRDYIHITDLAKFHTALLRIWDEGLLFTTTQSVEAFNVGSGTATTVEEVLEAFDKCCGTKLGAARVFCSRLRHEGANTAASMAKVATIMTHWWRSVPRRSLEEAVSDYRRIQTSQAAAL